MCNKVNYRRMTNVICPRCGEVNDAAQGQFCRRCGSPLNSSYVDSQRTPIYIPHKSSYKIKTGEVVFAVLAIIVTIVVLFAIFAYPSLFSGDGDDGGDGGIDDNGGSTLSTTYLTVSDAAPYESYQSYTQPDEGNRYVAIYMNFTNQASSNVGLNPFYFSITCSNNNVYSHCWKLDNLMSDTALPSTTTAIRIYFEIPESVTPLSINFEGLNPRYDCSSSLTNVWTNSPIHGPRAVSLQSLSYSHFTDYSDIGAPELGNKYILVTVTVTNLMTTAVSINQYNFKVITVNGLIHYPTYRVNSGTSEWPDGLQPGASITLSVGFEIRENDSPAQFKFESNGYFTTMDF